MVGGIKAGYTPNIPCTISKLGKNQALSNTIQAKALPRDIWLSWKFGMEIDPDINAVKAR